MSEELFALTAVLAVVYTIVALFVYTVNSDPYRAYTREGRQALLGYAIWWFPCLIYMFIVGTIRLVIWTTMCFVNATIAIIRREFTR